MNMDAKNSKKPNICVNFGAKNSKSGTKSLEKGMNLDLIDECGQDLAELGYESLSLGKFSITQNKLFVDSAAKEKRFGFARGHYFVLNAPLLPDMPQQHYEILKNELVSRLKFLLKENKIGKNARVLFVGIGNPNIMADSFGVRAVEKIEIFPFKKNNRKFKIMPNIFASTGLNAYQVIRLVVEAFDIDAVFLFDSLATSVLGRLGCSLQLNDAGLTPGSAINNFGMAINRDTLNAPCFALGVPTMISSRAFGEKREVILADKDVLEQVEFLSKLVAAAIDEVL